MATINLGAIKFNWKGAYNSSTSYAVDDVVSSGGNSYVCIQAHSNQAVGNATAYWNIMSSAGTNGTNGTDLTSTLTTQGDIVYRDGSGLARLGYGTSGNVLTTKGSGQNPVWEAAVGGKILQVVHTANSNGTTISAQNSYSDVSGSSISITPSATSSKIIHVWNTGAYGSDNAGHFVYQVYRDSTEIRKVYLGVHNNGNEESSPATLITLDSPNTTSQITYKVRAQRTGSGNPLYVNTNSNLNGQHNYLLEIGA